jgi:hypothetical protein
MAKRNAASSKKPAKPKTAEQLALQEALQVNWELRGCMKNVQIAFLRAATLLVRMRDEKLYLPMTHKTLEEYASEHLKLERSSLYKYLRVYDWVKANHPEWLDPKPGTFIPELADIADIVQIEKELKKEDLSPEKKKALDGLRKKALKGELHDGALPALKKGTRGSRKDGLKRLISKLRAARQVAVELSFATPGIIAQIDTAIEMAKNLMAVKTASFERLDILLGKGNGGIFS